MQGFVRQEEKEEGMHRVAPSWGKSLWRTGKKSPKGLWRGGTSRG